MLPKTAPGTGGGSRSGGRPELSSTPARPDDLAALRGGGHDDDASDPAAGVAGLVVAVVDIVRALLERQALRRMDAGTLTEQQVERLGRALLALEDQVRHLAELLGLRGPDPPGSPS